MTHSSLYDGTVEGLDYPELRARSAQFHPEAAPGPHDAASIISDWVEELKTLPRRRDLQSICLIGSGPIVIGQAAEFDYAGSQALKVLREDGFRTIVVNSNPATIMTDPGSPTARISSRSTSREWPRCCAASVPTRCSRRWAAARR